MKRVLLIALLILPLAGEAKWGWSFSDYSLLAGQQYRPGTMPSYGFDLQYDRFSRTCTNHSAYRGLGINYSTNSNRQEFGLKAMLNPTRSALKLTRYLSFHPYLFGQGNLVQTKQQNPVSNEKSLQSYFGFRPGLGLAGRYSCKKRLNVRSVLQLGYDLPVKNAVVNQSAWVLELKIGIGLKMGKQPPVRKSGCGIPDF